MNFPPASARTLLNHRPRIDAHFNKVQGLTGIIPRPPHGPDGAGADRYYFQADAAERILTAHPCLFLGEARIRNGKTVSANSITAKNCLPPLLMKWLRNRMAFRENESARGMP